MTDHYYSKTPTTESRPRKILISVRGSSVELTTDSGVFSKQGLDFGTRLLLETVTLPDAGLIVDLGCGYGVVTAVLARDFPDCTWLMIDVNERALSLATQNVAFCQNRVRIVQSDGFQAVADTKADVILLNPPIRAGKAVTYRLFTESYEHLQDGGSLWIVIHKKHGAASTRSFLEETFERVELVERDAGYHIFRCMKTILV